MSLILYLHWLNDLHCIGSTAVRFSPFSNCFHRNSSTRRRSHVQHPRKPGRSWRRNGKKCLGHDWSTFCGLMAAMLLGFASGSWRHFTYIICPSFCWWKLVQVQLLVVLKTARICNLIWTTTSLRITSWLVGLHGEWDVPRFFVQGCEVTKITGFQVCLSLPLNNRWPHLIEPFPTRISHKVDDSFWLMNQN